MTMTPNGNATTWRDLVDQLTPEQIAELEYCEREQIPPGVFSPATQLNCARAMAQRNIIQVLCADLPLPPHAAGDVDDWQEWGDGYGRMYTVSVREVDGMSVEVLGAQFDDGRTELSVLAREADQMSGEQTRRFAAMLVEAADEIDRLSAGGAR